MLGTYRFDHWQGRSIRTLAIAACVLLVGMPGCAPPVTQLPKSEEGVFSDDDRRAALTLSLSRSKAIAVANDPYEQAVQCFLAIKSIADRFRMATAGNPELMETLDKAQRIYSDRAAASRNAKEGVPAHNGDARRSESMQDPADRARLALACLQDLA